VDQEVAKVWRRRLCTEEAATRLVVELARFYALASHAATPTEMVA
jgi:hypothetical protein